MLRKSVKSGMSCMLVLLGFGIEGVRMHKWYAIVGRKTYVAVHRGSIVYKDGKVHRSIGEISIFRLLGNCVDKQKQMLRIRIDFSENF